MYRLHKLTLYGVHLTILPDDRGEVPAPRDVEGVECKLLFSFRTTPGGKDSVGLEGVLLRKVGLCPDETEVPW